MTSRPTWPLAALCLVAGACTRARSPEPQPPRPAGTRNDPPRLPAIDLGPVADATCPAVAADREGVVYQATRDSVVASNLAGARRWAHPFAASAHAIALSDSRAGSGVAAVVTAGARADLVRLSEHGDVLWSHPLGSLRSSSASVLLDDAGGALLASTDGSRAVLVGLDAQGKTAFTRTWPRTKALHLVRTSDDKLVVGRLGTDAIRFTWLDPKGTILTEHEWALQAASFVLQAGDDATVIAIANSDSVAGSPPMTIAHDHMGFLEAVFLKLAADGRVDYQFVPEWHGYGFVDGARVDALAVDTSGHLWLQGNMAGHFGAGRFMTHNEGLYDDEVDVGDALCGRFLAVFDRHGDPIWAHTLANLVTCEPQRVALVAPPTGGIVVAFNHRGRVPLTLPGQTPPPRDKEGCELLRFDAVPPFELADHDDRPPPLGPDTGRTLGVTVDGRHVP